MNSEKQSTNLQMTLREVNRVGERQKNVPKIRFKGYEDAWEQRKLGQVLDFSLKTNSLSRSMLNYEEGELKNIHYGDILMDYGPILNFKTDTIPYITEGKVEEFTSQLLMNGDVVFADAAEDESVGKAIEINGLEEQCLVSGLHTIVGRPTIKFAERFLGYYINSNSYHNQLLPLMQGTKVSSISKTTLQKTMIIYPKVSSEQLRIGSFFYSLESIITLHQRKYDALKLMKKTLLSKMFPKNGEDVPEIRFKGFTDAWEQRKLEEFLKERTERAEGDEELLSVTINKGVIRQLESDKKNNSSENKSNYKLVYKGDIPYNSMRMWQGAVGVSQFEGIVSPAYTVLIPTEEADGKFLMELFKKSSSLQIFTRWSQGLTSDTWNLKYPTLSKISFFVPYIKEQNKIAKLLQELDDLITLHQRKLDELKNMKKTLLQKMFV